MLNFEIMAENTIPEYLPHIFYNCYYQKVREGESFAPSHVLSYTIAGQSDITVGDKTFNMKAGDLFLYRRNQLGRYTKTPPPDGVYESVSISLDEQTLRSLAAELHQEMDQPWTGDTMLRLPVNAMLSNYIDSLKPYLNRNGDINPTLAAIKVKEAAMILLQLNPALKNFLFDFSPPGKLDLEGFMNTHYKYNVDLNRFAYLTGRSLASFKRDFEKIFHASPNKWLQQKRLQDAYYLLKEKGWRSSDVYLEVGFKDLSHFSFAFKKAFGITPSHVGASRA